MNDDQLAAFLAVQYNFSASEQRSNRLPLRFVKRQRRQIFPVQPGQMPVDSSLIQAVQQKMVHLRLVGDVKLRILCLASLHARIQPRRIFPVQVALVGKIQQHAFGRFNIPRQIGAQQIIFIQTRDTQLVFHTSFIPDMPLLLAFVSFDQ